MRKHTLEATGGQTLLADGPLPRHSGKPTGDEKAAAIDAKSGQPVANPARDIWISSTAFQSALNTAYFAESVATFVIAMGAALLLVGIGFLVLTIRLLKPEACHGTHRADRRNRRGRRLSQDGSARRATGPGFCRARPVYAVSAAVHQPGRLDSAVNY